MLRSTYTSIEGPVRTDRATLRGEAAQAERDLEAELVRRLMPLRYGDPPQAEGVGAGTVDPADARAAAAEPGGLDQRPVGFAQLVRAAVRIREKVGGGPDLPLELAAGSGDFPPRFRSRDQPQI